LLRLPAHWVWDSWPVTDGDTHHLFYLQAPRSLGDPELRHVNATIGHAVSTDYRNWTVLPDALAPADAPAWDDLATWTGSVVRAPTGTWHLFYSAISRAGGTRVQRIGRADSTDLITWRRFGTAPVVEADPRWYEVPTDAEVAWRDPWVFSDPSGAGWHMLITARVPEGPAHSRGVIAHAHSNNLDEWTVLPPLTEPAGFGHLEVPQVASVGGGAVLLFCCTERDLSPDRMAAAPRTGMWSAPASSLLGPYNLAAAVPLEDPALYAAHLLDVPGTGPALLGFTQAAFDGAIPPPLPVHLTPHGTLSPTHPSP
jgi:beta-fructofuranosidase